MLFLGNLTLDQFAERVGAKFSDSEINSLKASWSPNATLVSPEQWHIFEHPSIQIHVGDSTSEAVAIFMAANSRTEFTQEVAVAVVSPRPKPSGSNHG